MKRGTRFTSRHRRGRSCEVHDFEPGYDTFTEKPGYTWNADLAFADVSPEAYVAVVIPGGRAPEYIRNAPDFRRIIRHFFDEEKPVAQLCHAPLALAARASSPAGGPRPTRLSSRT
jgi:putative intracellular protease/amidase